MARKVGSSSKQWYVPIQKLYWYSQSATRRGRITRCFQRTSAKIRPTNMCRKIDGQDTEQP